MPTLDQQVSQVAEQLVAKLRQIGVATNEWRAAEVAYPQLAAALDDGLQRLAETNVWGTANRLPSGLVWQLAGDWLTHGEMLHRARFKPRGYAGDDVLLGRICQEWRCAHPLGSLIDRYFQQHAAPQAVRNRTQYITTAILEAWQRCDRERFRVVSVGSGPALDIEQAVVQIAKEHRQRWQVVLLDLDEAALDAASKRLRALLEPEQIVVHRENLFRLPQRASKLNLAPADFVFSTGFFDYLPDADAAALLTLLWQTLDHQGRLVVFNFAPRHPSQALMEWLGNWYLIYRDASQMHRLAAQAGLASGNYTLTAEPLGIDLAIDAINP